MNESSSPENKGAANPEGHEKISYTAIGVAHARTFSNIPYSQEIAEICDTDQLTEDSKEMHHQLSPFFEGRFHAVTNLLEQSGVKNILEVGAGISPRGLMMSKDPGIHYVETDLPEMLHQKEMVLQRLLEKENMPMPTNLSSDALNILDASAFERIVDQFPEGPIAIVHEGVLVYFMRDEKEKFAKIVHAALAKRGGVWITTDILTREDLLRNMPTKQIKDSVDDVVKNTGRDYTDAAFVDTEDAQKFFDDLGFTFTIQTFKETAGELGSTEIGLDPEFVENQLAGTIWTLRVKEAV